MSWPNELTGGRDTHHIVVLEVRPGVRTADRRPQPGFIIYPPLQLRLCRSRRNSANAVRLLQSRFFGRERTKNPGCGRLSAVLNPGLISYTTLW